MDYQAFLASKQIRVMTTGKVVSDEMINPTLFPFQRDIVKWAVRKGRAAIFADTGLGKTFMQVEWTRLIVDPASRALILAPLAVVHQTAAEAAKLGVTVRVVREDSEVDAAGIYITNYENLHNIDSSKFTAVVLDESSILKSFDGKTRGQLVTMFADTPYKLACTATPAPNDLLELGNHADFLGVMTSQQMTSVFFVHDAGVFQGDSSKQRWRLKRHAKGNFFRWLASWAIAIKRPSDLGYSDEGYNLPALHINTHIVSSDYTPEGMLPGFHAGNVSATEAKAIRRKTIHERVAVTAGLVNTTTTPWVVWTGLNDEADAAADAIPDAVNVHGSMTPEVKADSLRAFIEGKTRVLVSKTSIAGFGINMQHCANMVFCGMDFSWEAYYQAIRRLYRFGQKSEVNVHIIITEQERGILDTVLHKEREATNMSEELIAASKRYSMEELSAGGQEKTAYREDKRTGNGWTLYLGDSAERMREIADNSIHLSVYSPPFSDMYIYNNSERDLSNSKDLQEFFAHYAFIIRENFRITMPGRLACVHVQDPKQFKNKHGYRGLSDFPGEVIRAYQAAGWIFRSRITIDKNPQIVASRNKDTDLLFVTGKRDASDLAPMATDYVLVFKKPGDNPVPITPYANGEMTEDEWIAWAHAVWYSIRETDVLNVEVAKANDDEKHMSPLQLPLIERCLKLWSNPHETVFTPFAGIGSELYVSVINRRKAIGIELKPEYFNAAIRNLEVAEHKAAQTDLFAWAEKQAAGG